MITMTRSVGSEKRVGRRLASLSVPTLVLVAVLLATTGCGTVEPWQKGTLALEPMSVENDICHRFEHNFETYREGAVGANGGKSGGGCGCS